MDKLTTERLHQYQKSFDARDDHQGDFRVDDVRAMVAELLSLRTDAGDEEVLYLRAVVCNGIWSKDKRDHEEADKAIDRIVSKAVSLRNELREARGEVERLKRDLEVVRRLENNWLTENLQWQDQNKSLQSQVATLTAERDEARRREQIMAHHCQKFVEMTDEQAEAAYDAAEPIQISEEEINRIVTEVMRTDRHRVRDRDADAERYQWLRSHSWLEGDDAIHYGPGCNQLEPQHLDNAIDRDMQYAIPSPIEKRD